MSRLEILEAMDADAMRFLNFFTEVFDERDRRP